MGEQSKFGLRLREIRTKKGLGLVELADLAKVPYETIYRIETGRHKTPRLDIAIKLARTLGVSLDYLAGTFEEEMKPASVG